MSARKEVIRRVIKIIGGAYDILHVVYCAGQRDFDLGLKWRFYGIFGHVSGFVWLGNWKRSGVGRVRRREWSSGGE